MTPVEIVINFFIALLLGSVTAYLAKGRGRNPVPWFFIGMFFGLIGLIALFIFPVIKENEPVVRQYGPELTINVEPQPLLPERWFYLDEAHTQFGPVNIVELEKLYREKKIGAFTYVWTEGMPEWKKISDVNQLFSKFES